MATSILIAKLLLTTSLGNTHITLTLYLIYTPSGWHIVPRLNIKVRVAHYWLLSYAQVVWFYFLGWSLVTI